MTDFPTDPVCGMDVDLANDQRVVTLDDVNYRFCSDGCHTKFKADPGKYLDADRREENPKLVPGAVYICPMDPEVREQEPGNCPRCGMALEPESPIVQTKTQYTCPMHPEIVQDSPGDCPICGMALEPVVVQLDEEENPELVDMTRRFWGSLFLTIPVFVVAMGEMIPGNPFSRIADARIWSIVQLLLASPVVLWGDGRSLYVPSRQSRMPAPTCSR